MTGRYSYSAFSIPNGWVYLIWDRLKNDVVYDGVVYGKKRPLSYFIK